MKLIEDPSLIDTISPIHNKIKFSRLRQYIYSLIVSFGCLCGGTVLAWTSPVLPHITKNATELVSNATDNSLYISDAEAGIVGSIVAIGAMIGALPAGYLSRKYGVKNLIISIACVFVIGWLITIYSQLYTILIGRFVNGVATGAICVCIPVYISEIASVEIRGTLGSFFQVSFCFGILLINLLGSAMEWTQLSYAAIVCPILYLVLLTRIPALQLQNGDDFESNKSILAEIKQRHNYRALIVGLGLVSSQQLSGVNAVIFYASTIFTAAGSTMSPNISAIVIMAVQLSIAMISAVFTDRFNRRTLLTISAIGMACALMLLGAYFLARPALPPMVPVISLVAYFLCYCIGYGPLPWLMLGEIFNVEFKSIGCSIATTFNWILVFSVTVLFPILCSRVGEGWTFLLFGTFNIAATIFTLCCVPETRGKTSEDIQVYFKSLTH